MPWKECHVVDERLRFIARRLDGEKMAGLCREFSISRKTGYKIYVRYKDCGLEGLTDRSRRPYRHANRLPMQIETLTVSLKKEYPRWGAPKIRERLRRRYSGLGCPPYQHRPRGARPAWSGDPPEAAPVPSHGHRALPANDAQRALVCRLQGRVHAHRPALLLSADDQRLRYPSAAASVREGLDDTLTVLGLGLSERLQRSLATTNAIESLLSRTRHVKRNVKRWRGGTMVLRGVTAGVLEAAKGFRRVKGCKDMLALVAALRARDARLERFSKSSRTR